jgi:hypothetical protein
MAHKRRLEMHIVFSGQADCRRKAGTTGTSALLHTTKSLIDNYKVAANWAVSGRHPGYSNRKYSRVITTGAGTPGDILNPSQTQVYHVPLPFHYTLSPGKFFPMAAVHGINDVRVTMRLRSLEELILIKPSIHFTGATYSPQQLIMPQFASGVFKHFRLRAQYYSLSGPEGSALAAKEQVQLYHDWQHLRSLKTIKSTHKVDIDLNFLHPVKEIIMVVRRASEMTNDVTINIAETPFALNLGPSTKNRFAFHGDKDIGDPNIDGLRNSHVSAYRELKDAFEVHADITNFRLKLNGSERHNNISDGLSREYLEDRIVAKQRPHTYGAVSKLNTRTRGTSRAPSQEQILTQRLSEDL